MQQINLGSYMGLYIFSFRATMQGINHPGLLLEEYNEIKRSGVETLSAFAPNICHMWTILCIDGL